MGPTVAAEIAQALGLTVDEVRLPPAEEAASRRPRPSPSITRSGGHPVAGHAARGTSSARSRADPEADQDLACSAQLLKALGPDVDGGDVVYGALLSWCGCRRRGARRTEHRKRPVGRRHSNHMTRTAWEIWHLAAAAISGTLRTIAGVTLLRSASDLAGIGWLAIGLGVFAVASLALPVLHPTANSARPDRGRAGFNHGCACDASQVTASRRSPRPALPCRRPGPATVAPAATHCHGLSPTCTRGRRAGQRTRDVEQSGSSRRRTTGPAAGYPSPSMTRYWAVTTPSTGSTKCNRSGRQRRRRPSNRCAYRLSVSGDPV